MSVQKIPPSWHYVSEKQGALWRAVAAAHAPSGEADDPVARAYEEMFETSASELSGTKIHLFGMGAGSGQKERRYAARLTRAGCEVDFTAVDVSDDLATEAARQLGGVIEGKAEVLVGDFREANLLTQRLPALLGTRTALFTGFGLSPNLPPEDFFPNVRRLLAAGNRAEGFAMVSANLWPDTIEAEPELMAQYDNAETRQWLGQLFLEWGLPQGDVPELNFCIGEVDGVAAVQAIAVWPHLDADALGMAPAIVRSWRPGERIEVFSSLR